MQRGILRTHGFSLAGAICVVSISLIAVLTVATASSVNQQILQRNENTQTASDLADSAIQQAVAEIAHQPSWGNNKVTDHLEINGPIEGSSVRVTFDEKLGIPHGTSNQIGSVPVPGWEGSRLLPDKKVPEKRVHVVAVAKCRNVTRTKEAILYVPNYCLSLAATGKVHLTNSVVGSIKERADAAKVATQPELLGPGDLATNCNLPDSVILESSSRVCGDLQSRGDVSLQSGSSVAGEVRKFYSSTPMPEFPFDDYDPKKDDKLDYRSLPPGTYPAQKMTGLVRCDGDTVIDGDLDLDNCLLFCVGDLKITGSLRGSGAAVVKGATEIRGGGDLEAQDGVALIARKDVSLLGSSGKDYRFQGLIYTNGNFVANRFTVVGGFIADGGPGNGNVDLHDSKIYWNTGALNLSFFRSVQFVIQLPSDGIAPKEESLRIETGPKISPKNQITVGESPLFNPVCVEGGALATMMAEGGDPSQIRDPKTALAYSNGPGEWKWWAPVVIEIQKESPGPGLKPVLFYYAKYRENNQNFVMRRESAELLAGDLAQLCDMRAHAYCDAIDQGHGGVPTAKTMVETVDGPKLLQRETIEMKVAVNTKMLKDWESKNLLKYVNEPGVNFSFDPNRFIKESEKLRLSAAVEY